jgi:hypothetical protein
MDTMVRDKKVIARYSWIHIATEVRIYSVD